MNEIQINLLKLIMNEIISSCLKILPRCPPNTYHYFKVLSPEKQNKF